jgi:hypothetical protein
MTTQLMWLQLMVPASLLLVGHLLLTVKRFVVTERGKEKSDAASAESNRMLGLAFQGRASSTWPSTNSACARRMTR